MASKNLAEIVQKSALKPERLDAFKIGDTVDVHVKIVEGEKERIQIFSGIVISRKGGGINESFTVRRLVGSEGVERVWPLHSPSIEKIEVKKSGKVRRAKLYYLRDRVGKATRVAEQQDMAVKPRVADSVPPPQPKRHKEAKPEAKAEEAKA
ncbi:MAG: 50S ribosomal protein L19 [Planctomycetota bacterium]|nr:50S ribosomal protein L19 [Planctomycetota bacterium]